MNKLTEQNLLKKSRFLKYSLLASISVGAVMAMPVEGIAMGIDKKAFCTELNTKLLLKFSQSSVNKDTISTTQETNNNLSNNVQSNKSDMTEEVANVTTESLCKVSKMQAPEFKASENKFLNTLDFQTLSQELDRNSYTTKPIPQKPEIMLTTSSTTTSMGSNSFVNISSASSLKPVTPQQSAPDFKPNYSLGSNTPINIKELSFSSEQQQIAQHSNSTIPLMPTTSLVLPVKKSSVEIAPEMVNNISRVDDTVSIKSSEVTEDIKGTKGKKNKKILANQFNKSIGSWSKKTGKNKYELNKDSSKIEKFRKDLTTKNKDTDRLSAEIDISETKVSAFQAQQARIDEAHRDLLNPNQQKAPGKRLEENKTKGKVIKAAVDGVQKIFNNAKKKISRTKLKKLQDQVGNHVIIGTSTIPNPLLISKPTMQFSNKLNGTLLEDEDGYLVPCEAQPQIYTVILPGQEIENHKSMDSDLLSLSTKTLGKEIDEVHPNIGLSSEKEIEAKLVEDETTYSQDVQNAINILNTTNDKNTARLFGQHNNKLTLDLHDNDRKKYYETHKQLSNSIRSPKSDLTTNSSLASSLNIFGSNEDLSWDNAGDIGVGYRYGDEYSCPTPDDKSSSKLIDISDKNTTKVKGLEEGITMYDSIDLVADSLKSNAVSFKERNEALKQLSTAISETVISLSESNVQEDAEDILDGSILQAMLNSNNDKSIESLSLGSKEQEETEAGIRKAGDKQLLPVPVLLSDCKENEYLSLGNYNKGEKNYDSDFKEEEETIEQLSNSDWYKMTKADTAILLEQEAKQEMQTQISENAPTLNQAKVINTIVNNMIRNRLDTFINMVVVGAGDEEESNIKRGLWMRAMYGTNNHGRVNNMTGYRGINKGATVGFDAKINNNIIGIAYSNVHSVFKFKNSKNNDKELIGSKVISIYGQKELQQNFTLQVLVSASKNFIKDKINYSYGDTKIRSNVKHHNHSYNAEALLNYNYLVKNSIIVTPNIGLRYGKSRDGIYNETGINVQKIALTMKENNILSGILGTKVQVSLRDVLKFNNLGLTFQAAVEHNFEEKTQRINRVVKIFDNIFKQDYLIPKQPKTSYNLGTGIIFGINNTNISVDYNYYLNKHYRSHQGSVKIKVNL
ncbi:autotransporter outer membrane beta-barrel domain-containing protein [Rickettsia typhi]|uniref:autotransporter outer membrane beta-barrel domain-containing protein n=1 Tax=Rickettsia typhi TaxID=785 RepID=UPI000EFB2F36|nr:autotransporter outer membrane beta-barrel domain-containing protein [Rickettsia typhi]